MCAHSVYVSKLCDRTSSVPQLVDDKVDLAGSVDGTLVCVAGWGDRIHLPVDVAQVLLLLE